MIAIDYTQPERRLRELINEWLKGFFTGTAHTTPTGDRTFPAVDILFNQATLPDSPKPHLHIVWTAPKLPQQSYGIATITIPDATTYTGQCDEASGPWDMQIYVRVKDSGNGNREDHLCTNAADNLNELLRSSETATLAQHGFSKVTVLSGPTPLSVAGWKVRIFSVRGTVSYFLPRG